MLGEIWRAVMHWFMTLNSQEWLYVLLGTLAAGMLCMRGYGSRHNY